MGWIALVGPVPFSLSGTMHTGSWSRRSLKPAIKERRSGKEALSLRAILSRKPVDNADDEADNAAHLQVIITSDSDTPIAEIANLYRGQYPKQENAIRDRWLPLEGDVNERYQAQLEAAQREPRVAIQQREAGDEAASGIYCWARAEEARIQEPLASFRACMEAAAVR